MTELVREIKDRAERIDGRIIISVDGRCGAGKTTLAEMLSRELDAAVIHMDDYYLPHSKRTEQRMAEYGGNIDRERLICEVLRPLADNGSCVCRPYDCSADSFKDPFIIPDSGVYIIEGSYTCHPDLWGYSDLHVFLSVSREEQMKRLIQREGAERAEVFRTTWIPREERYFAAFGIADRCELVYDGE